MSKAAEEIRGRPMTEEERRGDGGVGSTTHTPRSLYGTRIPGH
jgi:hypothetical protein